MTPRYPSPPHEPRLAGQKINQTVNPLESQTCQSLPSHPSQRLQSLSLADPSTVKNSNLAKTLLWLPPGIRSDMLTFFRFCRAVDDLADGGNLTPACRTSQLLEWKAALQGKGNLPTELTSLLKTRGIETDLLVAIVEGCLSDAGTVRFATIQQLRDYCWKVACAVGLVCVKIFRCQSPESNQFAVHLGYALQFTNICRDISEDALFNRIYIPQEILHRHGTGTEALTKRREDEKLKAAQSEIAQMACREFGLARRVFPTRDAARLRPACMMAAIYWCMLTKIRRPDQPIFGPRIRPSLLQTLAILLAGKIIPPAWLLPDPPTASQN